MAPIWAPFAAGSARIPSPFRSHADLTAKLASSSDSDSSNSSGDESSSGTGSDINHTKRRRNTKERLRLRAAGMGGRIGEARPSSQPSGSSRSMRPESNSSLGPQGGANAEKAAAENAGVTTVPPRPVDQPIPSAPAEEASDLNDKDEPRDPGATQAHGEKKRRADEAMRTAQEALLSLRTASVPPPAESSSTTKEKLVKPNPRNAGKKQTTTKRVGGMTTRNADKASDPSVTQADPASITASPSATNVTKRKAAVRRKTPKSSEVAASIDSEDKVPTENGTTAPPPKSKKVGPARSKARAAKADIAPMKESKTAAGVTTKAATVAVPPPLAGHQTVDTSGEATPGPKEAGADIEANLSWHKLVAPAPSPAPPPVALPVAAGDDNADKRPTDHVAQVGNAAAAVKAKRYAP